MSVKIKLIEDAAKRYANALFSLSQDHKQVKQVTQDILNIKNLIAADEHVARIAHSEITPKHLLFKLVEIFKSFKIQKETENLLILLIKNSRFYILNSLCKYYLALLAESNNEIEFTIVSVKELTKEQQQKLSSEFGKKLKKTVIIKNNIEAEILGGIVVNYGYNMIDASLRNKIDRLKNQFNQSILTIN